MKGIQDLNLHPTINKTLVIIQHNVLNWRTNKDSLIGNYLKKITRPNTTE